MKKEAKETNPDKKVMAYININKRVTELFKMGLLEEIKPDVHTVNIHGRKDYKVTQKGMEQLALYILRHPEVNEFIHEYMDKTPGLNKLKLGQVLVDIFETHLKSINAYMQSVNEFFDANPTNPHRYKIIMRDRDQILRISAQIGDLVATLHNNDTALVMESKSVKSKPSIAADLRDSKPPTIASQKKKH